MAFDQCGEWGRGKQLTAGVGKVTHVTGPIVLPSSLASSRLMCIVWRRDVLTFLPHETATKMFTQSASGLCSCTSSHIAMDTALHIDTAPM